MSHLEEVVRAGDLAALTSVIDLLRQTLAATSANHPPTCRHTV
jgi:hypothetical protein